MAEEHIIPRILYVSNWGRSTCNVQRFYENNLSAFGLTPVQYFVIVTLYNQDGMKFKDLANSLSIEGPTPNRVVGPHGTRRSLKGGGPRGSPLGSSLLNGKRKTDWTGSERPGG